MRGIWEALRDSRNPCSVLTKSPLLLRDLDLLKEIAAVTDVSACLSVPTLDEKAWRATEPHTPHPRARLEAVAELNRDGIPTGVLIAPLMPGINDAPEQVEKIVELATEAGATYIGGQTLFLRGAVREIFFDWLRELPPGPRPALRAPVREGRRLSPGRAAQDRARRRRPWLRPDRDLTRTDRHRGGHRPPPLMPARRAAGETGKPVLNEQTASEGGLVLVSAPRPDLSPFCRVGTLPLVAAPRVADRRRDATGYGAVVDSVSVSVLAYVPVRSASLAPMDCLNSIVTASLETGPVVGQQARARRRRPPRTRRPSPRAWSGVARENAPLTRLAGGVRARCRRPRGSRRRPWR